MSPAYEETTRTLAQLRRDVDNLTTTVSTLKQVEDKVVTATEALRARVEALEKRFSAMEARMTHIDTMLMELQGEVRRTARAVEALSSEQSNALGELRSMMLRTLDLLQPKVTVGSADPLPADPVAGG